MREEFSSWKGINPVLNVKGLVKHYGRLKAVDGLEFSVCPGEIFGLLGPNGAGKSTAIDCILGTKKEDSGSIELLGHRPGQGQRGLYNRIGVQFQDSHYPDRIRVGEICRMIAGLYRNTVEFTSLLHRFGLAGKEKQEVSRLSGGEKQKLSLVLALVHSPEILFLDELTTGLDAAARREVWQYLKNLKEEGVTLVLTTHYMEEAAFLCDRILILNKGKEVAAGTPGEIMLKAGKDNLEEAYLYFTGSKEEAYESPVCSV